VDGDDEFGQKLEAASTGDFDFDRGVDFWRCDLMRWGFEKGISQQDYWRRSNSLKLSATFF